LWEAARTVDKSGCLKLEGHLYEAGTEYIRKKVILRYDPFDPKVVQLWYRGQKAKLITLARIGESNQTVKVPVETLENASESRILKTYAKEQQKNKAPGEIFTQTALGVLHEYAGGIPRKVNKVATACLMAAAGKQHRLIDDHLMRVVIESEFEA